MKHLKYDVFNSGTSMYSVKMTIAFTSWSTHSLHKSTSVSWRGICVRIKALGSENDYKIKTM